MCNFKKTIPADLEAQLASLREGVSLLSNNKQQVIDTCTSNKNHNNNNNNLILIIMSWWWLYDNDNVIDNNNSNSVVHIWTSLLLEISKQYKLYNYSETWITAVSDNVTYVVKISLDFGFLRSHVIQNSCKWICTRPSPVSTIDVDV